MSTLDLAKDNPDPATHAGPDGPSLASHSLPAVAFGLLAAIVIAISLGLFQVTGLAGRADFLVFTIALYVVAATALSFAVEGGRIARDRLATTVMWGCFGIACIPLVSVVAYVISKGSTRFDAKALQSSTRNIADTDTGGGFYHAIIGTVEQVGIATIIAVPLALLCAVFLVEYAAPRSLARAVSFFVDVLTGLPSIVAGLFVYAFWLLVIGSGPKSGFAGSLALIIIMLPIVVRSSEQMLRLVPNALRESSYALGVPKWKTILRIVVPTALPGMVTGVLLAISRVVGETAPVLLLIFGTDRINTDPFHGPQESLALFVFSNATKPNQPAIDRAWAAALTLILIVLILNLLARVITRASRISR